MSQQEPSGILEVLARAAGTGVSNAAQNFRGDQQQKKTDALQGIMAIYQQQEQQRAAEEHRMRILGFQGNMVRLDAQTRKLNMENAEAALSDEQRLEREKGRILGLREIDVMPSGVKALPKIAPSPTQMIDETTEWMGGIPTDVAPGFTFKGPHGSTYEVPDPTASTGKTLSAKDRAVLAGIDRDYPKATATMLKDNYLAGETPFKDAYSQYYRSISTSKGGDLFGSVAKPEHKAQAAHESGFSPEYGGTKDEVIAGYEKKRKSGKMTDKEADNLIALAKAHFKNLKNDILNYFNSGGVDANESDN